MGPHSNPLTFVTLIESNNFINGSVNLLFQISNKTNPKSYKNRGDELEEIVNVDGLKNMPIRHWLVPEEETKEQSPNLNDENYEIVHSDLYCSDFYWNPRDNTRFKELANLKIRRLYLDSTYFDPKYAFMAEHALFENVANLMSDFMKESSEKKICFLFGIRFIERIKILLHLSKRFKEKIRVNKTKKRLISLLEFGADDNDRFVTNDEAKVFQAVDVANITFKNLKNRLKNDADLDRIVGIKLMNPKDEKGKIRKMTKKKITIVTVPYSEHCNFDELIAFIRMIEPLTIIPTANLKESTKCIAKYFR